jgi:hypothetical protein
MVGNLINYFLVLRPAILAWRRQVEAESDVASVVVFQLSASSIIAFLPTVAWFIVWLADRQAVKTRLGNTATWCCLVYLVITLGTIFWSETLITT